MKDRFRFRAIALDGHMKYGCLETNDIHHGYSIREAGCIVHKVDPETIGQCTGLKDRNGILIYGGDILSVQIRENDGFVGNVYQEESGEWCVMSWIWKVYLIADKCVVIGNVHQNPELLNK